MQRNLSLVVLAITLALSPEVRAQSFNLDVGTDNAVPSPALGAAAGQPGTWNQIAVNGLVHPLVDVSGAPSGVTFQRTIGGGTEFSWDNLGTTGDDELLMDDGEFPLSSPASTWVVSGLAAGTYEVYTYAWAPDDATLVSGVSVNGGPVTPVGGVWPNGYVLGVTHAFDLVTIPAGGTISIVISTVNIFSTFDGVQIKGSGSSFSGYCPGDGTGTACPCANSGAAGNGCASSVNASGAHLAGAGSASIATDTMVLTGSGMPNSSALYFQGTLRIAGGAGVGFGDGLRCVAGTIIRLGTKTNAAGTSTYPALGDLPISIKGANSAGGVRDYQCWYRNAAAFCTVSTFNLTNAVEVTWGP